VYQIQWGAPQNPKLHIKTVSGNTVGRLVASGSKNQTKEHFCSRRCLQALLNGTPHPVTQNGEVTCPPRFKRKHSQTHIPQERGDQVMREVSKKTHKI